jgi:archaellin
MENSPLITLIKVLSENYKKENTLVQMLYYDYSIYEVVPFYILIKKEVNRFDVYGELDMIIFKNISLPELKNYLADTYKTIMYIEYEGVQIFNCIGPSNRPGPNCYNKFKYENKNYNLNQVEKTKIKNVYKYVEKIKDSDTQIIWRIILILYFLIGRTTLKENDYSDNLSFVIEINPGMSDVDVYTLPVYIFNKARSNEKIYNINVRHSNERFLSDVNYSLEEIYQYFKDIIVYSKNKINIYLVHPDDDGLEKMTIFKNFHSPNEFEYTPKEYLKKLMENFNEFVDFLNEKHEEVTRGRKYDLAVKKQLHALFRPPPVQSVRRRIDF